MNLNFTDSHRTYHIIRGATAPQVDVLSSHGAN